MPRSLRRSSSFGVLAAVLSAVLSPAAAAPTREEIERSVKLREEWQYLTREIAWPAQWTPDSRAFTYRKTVEGGFAFETVNADTLAKTPAFDHRRLASELTRVLGRPVEALRLPFAEFRYEGDRQVIAFYLDEQGWRCSIVAYSCARQREAGRPRVSALCAICPFSPTITRVLHRTGVRKRSSRAITSSFAEMKPVRWCNSARTDRRETSMIRKRSHGLRTAVT
ncbi:hypothetical protein ACFSHP_24250 [Novosphingobium panipatense]